MEGVDDLYEHQSDGELSPEDRRLVLERLLLVDACASGSRECWLVSEGWPSDLSIPMAS
jgi:hypothetical protein